MTLLVALLLSAALALIGAIHMYWAFGGLWPAKDEAALVRMVVGTEDVRMPGRALTLLVSLLIFAAGAIPVIKAGILPLSLPSFLINIALAVLMMVFLIRGLVSYTPLAARMHTVEPFAGLNRRYYSPLCIVIGFGFAVLLSGAA